MTIANLKKNIGEIKKILGELRDLNVNVKYADREEKKFYVKSQESLFARLKIINDATSSILEDVSAVKRLEPSAEVQRQDNFVGVKYIFPMKGNSASVVIKKEDREKFLKELSLSEVNLKKISNKKAQNGPSLLSMLTKTSTKMFGRFADTISQNALADLKLDLRESNSKMILSTYIAVALFVSLIAFIISVAVVIAFSVVNISNIFFIWIPFLVLFVTIIAFYLFPSLEKSAVDSGVSNELPFATIYMASIAGSNLDPTKIFKIIADSPEYKYVGFEMRKVINQVDIYGYDLVNSLKNVAKSTINQKLADLLNGMATNISSGSSIRNYLEKKSEGLLLDYKLERQKYNDTAGTFMDIYISVLITAPLILVMVIVIMSLTNISLGGLSTETLVGMAIGLVALLNIIFLVFLQIRQPKV